MIRKLFLFALALFALGVAGLGVVLTRAHLAIRRERAPLPTASQLLAASDDDIPVRLSYLNTATQPMPRSAVLDPAQDPRPQAAYVMGHPSFVLEWADGRVLLIDAGMNTEQASSFGKPLQLVGAQPLRALGSAADRLGPERRRVAAMLFTHLHTDHTGGIVDLCRGNDRPIDVWLTAAQAERLNHTTRPGMRLVDAAGCARKKLLGPEPSKAVPGFAGVRVIDAGGHTPGSQVVVAYVRGNEGVRRFAFTGDIVNNVDGVTHDIPKPYLYRLLIVPEDDGRLGEVRRFLRGLRDESGFALLVSHDQRQIEASGVPAWNAAP